MRRLRRIKEKPVIKPKIWEPKEDRQFRLIKEYSKLDFNYHSVIRYKSNAMSDVSNFTKVYNQKLSQTYVDKLMDNLVKRKSINQAIAFVEQDDYLNNHLHFAWSCPIRLSRKQISNTMKTNERFIRDIRSIQNVEDAIAYFTKRIEAKGSYHNIYIN